MPVVLPVVLLVLVLPLVLVEPVEPVVLVVPLLLVPVLLEALVDVSLSEPSVEEPAVVPVEDERLPFLPSRGCAGGGGIGGGGGGGGFSSVGTKGSGFSGGWCKSFIAGRCCSSARSSKGTSAIDTGTAVALGASSEFMAPSRKSFTISTLSPATGGMGVRPSSLSDLSGPGSP